MSNKLRRYYVITPDTFESLKKEKINENELHALDKSMLQILRDKATPVGEKWLKYGQALTRHSEKLRKNNKIINNNHVAKKSVSTMTEPIEKHEMETMTEPIQTNEIETQVSPSLKRKKVVAKKKKPVKSLTELDEEDEKMYNEKKKFEEEENDRNDQSLFNEFGSKPPLRRSKRIKMQKMPTEFDSDLEEASFLQAQEEMKDFDDRNYKKYKPRFPDQRTIEHIPSSSVMTFDLEDVVDILTDEDVPHKRKNKKQLGGSLFRWDTL